MDEIYTIRLHRNHIPWIVIGVAYVVCPATLLLIRYLLAAENKRRDSEPQDDTYDNVYIEVTTSDGKRIQRKLDKVRIFLSSRFAQDLELESSRNFWISLIFRIAISDMYCKFYRAF